MQLLAAGLWDGATGLTYHVDDVHKSMAMNFWLASSAHVGCIFENANGMRRNTGHAYNS
jgi:succinate dehydrogenase hydrophobic anchor subunit